MNRALLFGEGLFETIHWKGRNYKLRKHYERLKGSAEFFGYPYPEYGKFIGDIEKATAGNKNLYVKYLLLFRGGDYYGDLPEGYETRVVVKELPKVPKSVSLCISSYRRHSKNPLFYHKTTSFLFNILVKREARKRGFFDGLVLNEEEFLTETSSANLLIYKRGKFYTPARESGLLRGTTLELLGEELSLKEEFISLDFLRDAEGVFILNSLIKILPVVEIEGERLRENGKLARELKEVIERRELLPESGSNLGEG
ncbi:aminotransferase class IV [Aquifex sp.]